MTSIGLSDSKIRAYLDTLLDVAGEYDDMSDEARVELQLQMALELDELITAAIASRLGELDANKFEQMLEDEKPDTQIEQYVRTKRPNLDAMVDEVFMLYAQGFPEDDEEISTNKNSEETEQQISAVRQSIQDIADGKI